MPAEPLAYIIIILCRVQPIPSVSRVPSHCDDVKIPVHGLSIILRDVGPPSPDLYTCNKNTIVRTAAVTSNETACLHAFIEASPRHASASTTHVRASKKRQAARVDIRSSGCVFLQERQAQESVWWIPRQTTLTSKSTRHRVNASLGDGSTGGAREQCTLLVVAARNVGSINTPTR